MKASPTVAGMAALLISSALPTAAQQTSPPAQQGEMSDAMMTKVGTALRHVVMIRQQYSQLAQAANSSQQRQTLSDQAGSEMLKAISDQGLSVQQYEQAIQMAQNNETLKRRLLLIVQSGD